jgi:single-stranded DNA-binding protein
MPEFKNEVHLIGTVATEPDCKQVGEDSTLLASFKINVGEKERKPTNRVVAWRSLAEQASGLKQGQWVEVRGTLLTRSYKAQDQWRYITEVVAEEILELEAPTVDPEDVQEKLQPEEGSSDLPF